LEILKQEIEKIIKDKTKLNIFDMEEIIICKDSNYYKYIDFKNIV
jgi:hypothetical protein